MKEFPLPNSYHRGIKQANRVALLIQLFLKESHFPMQASCRMEEHNYNCSCGRSCKHFRLSFLYFSPYFLSPQFKSPWQIMSKYPVTERSGADEVGCGFSTSAMLRISSILFVNQSNLQFFISFVLEKQFFSFCSEV